MIGDILQPSHLLFVLVIALLVLGPKRLPEVGRSLGRGLRDFRSALNGDERDRDDELLAPAAAAPPVAASQPVASQAVAPEPPQPSPEQAPQPAAEHAPQPAAEPAPQPDAEQAAQPEPQPAEHAS